MGWTKIIYFISWLYKVVKFFIVRQKGQTEFAEITLTNACIEAIINEVLETITIKNIIKIQFNELKKTVTFINDIGIFTFHVEAVKSIKLFDVP